MGPNPDHPEEELRLEAGAYRGRPTYFQVIGPWSKAARMNPTELSVASRMVGSLLTFIIASTLIAALLVTRRNLKLRRGDRVGATRLALALLTADLVQWFLGADHIADVFQEWERIFVVCGMSLLLAVWIWAMYIAVEPYVRRHWPQVLITWSRILAGRFRDPSVGRDLLIGALAAVGLLLAGELKDLIAIWLGVPPNRPDTGSLSALLGGRHVLGRLFGLDFALVSMLLLFLLFMLRVLLRKQWLATLVIILLMILPSVVSYQPDDGAAVFLVRVVGTTLATVLILAILIRLGFFALVAMFYFLNLLVVAPLTFDLSAWNAGASMFALLAILVIAGYAFHTALAGRSLIKGELLES